jgi:hypothetical protein
MPHNDWESEEQIPHLGQWPQTMGTTTLNPTLTVHKLRTKVKFLLMLQVALRGSEIMVMEIPYKPQSLVTNTLCASLSPFATWVSQENFPQMFTAK